MRAFIYSFISLCFLAGAFALGASPKLDSLKKLNPKLARKYKDKEPANFVKYKGTSYVWNRDKEEYEIANLGKKKKRTPPVIESPKLVKPASPKPAKPEPPKAPESETPKAPKPEPLKLAEPKPAEPPKKAPVPAPPPVSASPRVSSPPIASVVPLLSAAPKAVSRRRPKASAARKAGKKSAKMDAILQKADRSLKRHARKKSEIRDFLVRSYQRHYRKDALSDREVQSLMSIGLEHPGSLKAVLRNIKREYKGLHIQRYALAKIFRILRSEARVLLERY